MERPKVDVVFRAETMNYVVRIVFAMQWEIYWTVDSTDVSELVPQMFDDMAEDWAADSHIPLTIVEL